MGKSNTIKELEERKKQIEAELAQLQEGFDNSVDDIKHTIVKNVSPKQWIRKYPIESVGIAIVTGLLLGTTSFKRRKEPANTSASKDNSLRDIILTEIKKLAVKKGVEYLGKLLDSKLNTVNTDEKNS